MDERCRERFVILGRFDLYACGAVCRWLVVPFLRLATTQWDRSLARAARVTRGTESTAVTWMNVQRVYTTALW